MSDPYADAVDVYLTAGWDTPIPLGQPGVRARKAPVPEGLTGHGAKVPTPAQIERWRKRYAANNIGVHLPRGVIGIDVDHYTKNGKSKLGGKTLRDLEAELGELPATFRSTARGYDNPSGIRFYRTPPEVEFITKLEGDIEIIQAKHRYAVVWPSVHPDTNGVYAWYTDGLTDPGPVPHVEDLPELPDAWIDALSVNAVEGLNKAGGVKGEAEVRAWLRKRQGNGRCRAMKYTLAAEVNKLTDAGAGSRYDSARDGIMALVRLVAEGHHGGQGALAELHGTYEEAVAGEAHRDPTEWKRSVVGAVSALMGTEVELHGSRCPDRDGQTDETDWPPPSDPYAVATRYLELRASGHLAHRPDSEPLRYWRGSFWTWTGSHWIEAAEDKIETELYRLLADAEYWGAAEQPTKLTWKPDRTKVGRVMHALSRHSAVFLDSKTEPTHVESFTHIAFANGVLQINTDNGAREWLSHSPERFNLSALPFDYHEDAPRPKAWLAFLDSLELDTESLTLLQQWIGYVVSGETSKQKMMLLLGPTRAGKGVITRTLQRLVGKRNCATPTLDQFSQNFGLQSCIGKSLITVSDARFGGSRSAPVIEKLLNISGEDAMTIDRKNREPWEGALPGRVMIVSNQMPALSGEASSALSERFLGPLELHRSFLGNEDEELERRIVTELGSVLLWALEGYDALCEDGRFVAPEASKQAKRELVESLSPIAAFLRESCVRAPGWPVPRDKLYALYRRWCDANGQFAMSNIRFGRDLRVATQGAIQDGRPRHPDTGVQYRAYLGLRIRPEAEQHFESM